MRPSPALTLTLTLSVTGSFFCTMTDPTSAEELVTLR
jgi:hypothetical protein